MVMTTQSYNTLLTRTAKLKLANILQNLKRMKKPLWKNPNLSSWVCTCPCNWLGLLFFRKIAKKKKKKNAHIKIDQPCLSLHFEPESLITSSSSISFNNPFCCSSLAVVNWIWSAFILSWSDLLSGKAVAIFYPFCFHSGSLIPW